MFTCDKLFLNLETIAESYIYSCSINEFDMSEGPSKENDIPALSHTGTKRDWLRSVMNSACGCRQSDFALRKK